MRRGEDMSDVFAGQDVRDATVVVRDYTREHATGHPAASGLRETDDGPCVIQEL